ncbi:UNVERIFIED_CONTAM: hypothetical protein RMT77_012020 [Armadillidium vulgare]
MEKEEEKCDIYSEILKVPFNSISFQSCDDVIRYSQEKPDEFLKQLLIERQYSLALDWITLNNYNEKFSSEVPEILALKLLDNDIPDFESAEKVLDNVETNIVLIIIENLLKNTAEFTVRKFLISYVVSKNSCQFKTLDIWALQQELMGIILIEEVCLKTCDKSQLLSLVNQPNLIIEQWIMNLKLACVDKGIQKISSILNSVKCKGADITCNISRQEVDCLCWEHYYLMVEKYAVKALKLSGTQISIHEILIAEDCEIQFVMPHQVPSKSDWQENASVNVCPVCKIAVFSIFFRKHHCRRCGRVVCGDCSVFRHIVEGYGDEEVRVCEFCYRNMTESLSWDNDHLVNIDLSTEEEESDSAETTSISTNIGWYFTTDPLHNRRLREEFAFDFTPSLSVCHSLFTLHKDDSRAALAILNLCHKSFEKIVDSISLNLNTVDRYYVIKIINTLLLTAKVRFGKILNLDGVSVCEYYKQWSNWVESLLRLNLVCLLPKGTLNNVLEIGELMRLQLLQQGGEDLLLKNLKQEKISLKVLRDKLVKTENWDLALEICTKEGFDKYGVWSAHGVAALKAGDFKTAREQFDKIFKKTKNKNLNTKLSLLEDIVLFLENNEFKRDEEETIPESRLYTHSLKEYESSSSLHIAEKDKNEDDCSLFTSLNLKECDYYLRMYGSHQMYLQFLFRHELFRESIKYCQQIMVDEVLFSECILIPSFKSGHFKQLWSAIDDVDPKHVWIIPLIHRVYRYLNKYDHLPCLLEVQKILNDNLTACKTLLRMYKANSYKDLLLRNSYLKEIILLLKDFLNSNLVRENDKNIDQTDLFYKCETDECDVENALNQQILLTDAQFYLTEFLGNLENSGMDFKSKIKLVRELLKDRDPRVSKKVKNLDSEVPTLFEKEDRMVICVILLCLDTDLQSNLTAIRELVDKNCLDAADLLSLTLQTMVKTEEFQNLSFVIESILNWNYIPDCNVIDCLRSALTMKGISMQEHIVKEIAKFLTDTKDKLNIYIEVGFLKSAFSEINKVGTIETMEQLLKAAEEKEDKIVIHLCSKWLQKKIKNTRNVKRKDKERIT